MYFHRFDAARRMADDHWLMCVESLELFSQRSSTTTQPYILPESTKTYGNACISTVLTLHGGWRTIVG